MYLCLMSVTYQYNKVPQLHATQPERLDLHLSNCSGFYFRLVCQLQQQCNNQKDILLYLIVSITRKTFLKINFLEVQPT